VARVVLRVRPLPQARRVVQAAARFFRPLSDAEARDVARRLKRRGTCLSRALTIAARVPGAEIVIGRNEGRRFSAHAWVERGDEVLTEDEAAVELARLG
jgi:hypothetical protein